MARRANPTPDFDDVIAENLNVRESVIEAFFRAEAKEYNCVEHKVLGVRTWPDRNLYWPCGVCDMVELKRPKGGKYEKGQLSKHEELRGMGFECVTLKTKAEVRNWFRKRALTLGVPRRPKMARELRTGTMNAVEYAATLKLVK